MVVGDYAIKRKKEKVIFSAFLVLWGKIMNRFFLHVFLVHLFLILVVSCTIAKIYNVHNAPIPKEPGHTPSLDEVKKAILEAGKGLGWRMKDREPGLIEGILHVRSHAAVVEIPYTIDSYSIIYKNSSNLKYDSAQGTIHDSYNGWVQNLDDTIKERLKTL